jgi:hypothetical protein
VEAVDATLGSGSTAPDRDDAGPIGIFPTWGWVYRVVVVYGALVILALWILTRILDPGRAP